MVAQKDEVFYELRDAYIWEEFMPSKQVKIPSLVVRKWIAGILIVAGVIILWQNFSKFIIGLIPERIWNFIWPLVDNIPQILIAIVIMAGLREKIEYNDIPKPFQGTAIVLVTACLMSIAFMGFSGMI